MDDLEPNYEYSDTGFQVNRPIQYFSLAFRSPNVIRLINIDQHIASCVQEKIEQLLPLEKSGYVCFSDYHTGFTGRFNIYDLVLEKPFFKGMYFPLLQEMQRFHWCTLKLGTNINHLSTHST